VIGTTSFAAPCCGISTSAARRRAAGAGRERIYLDRFWNELSADPKGIDEETRQHYASLYARPHAIHDAFEQFGAFNQDAIDNKALLAKGGKITMPVLAIGARNPLGWDGGRPAFRRQQCHGRHRPQLRPLDHGRKSTGNHQAGHGVPRQMKAHITAASLSLLFGVAYAAPVSAPQLRVTPDEVDAMRGHESGAGTSGVAGIRTVVVAGDPTKPGPYTIRLSIPANTRIQAHTHRDNRTAVVVAGACTLVTARSQAQRPRKLCRPEASTPSRRRAHFAETKSRSSARLYHWKWSDRHGLRQGRRGAGREVRTQGLQPLSMTKSGNR